MQTNHPQLFVDRLSYGGAKGYCTRSVDMFSSPLAAR
jgi:hypothetical protein